MRVFRTPVMAALAAGSLVALAGCGGGGSDTSAKSDDFTVVTSTNVYADIVKNVAGDAADVSPVIDDPAKDPHDYEATAQDQLKLSKADMVVVNGGGYDAFMTQMLDAADKKPTVIDTVSISGLPGSEGVSNEPHHHDHGEEGHDHDHGKESGAAEEGHDHDHGKESGAAEEGHDHDHGKESGAAEEGHDHDHGKESGAAEEGHDHGEEGHDHDHGDFNEHVWYSVPTMTKLVDDVAAKLEEKLPDSADEIKKNAEKYKGELNSLQKKLDGIKAEHSGEKGAATEPIPLWLFHDMGVENITPAEFLEAVEHGDDVPPLVLKKAKEQIEKKEVAVLGYNEQNAGPQADELKKAAEGAGVPVVNLAETMGKDDHYIEWMGGYIDAMQKALAGHHH